MILAALVTYAVIFQMERKYSILGLDMAKFGSFALLGGITLGVLFLAYVVIGLLSIFVPTFIALGIILFGYNVFFKKKP